MTTGSGLLNFIAVGNTLYGDDGVGNAVLEELKQIPQYRDAIFFDAHTDALSLIDRFTDGLNIIIDAAKMGKSPGTVVRFTPENVKMVIQWDHLSMHGFGLAETFAMAEMIGGLPECIVIFGIEPEVIEIDKGLSDIVKNAIPKVLTDIQNEVKRYESTHNTGH